MDGPQDARVDGVGSSLGTLLLEHLLLVGSKGVKEMVDDVGSENLDTSLVGVLLSFLVNLDIETEHDGEFLVLFQHGNSLHNITLVDGTDRDAHDGNLGDPQELEQGFERTKSGGLYADTLAGGGNLAQETLEITHDIVLEILLIVVRAAYEQPRTSNGILEIVRSNLDTQSSLNLLVVDVLRLDTQLTEGLRGEQGSDVRTYRTVKTAEHNPVSFSEDTVREDNINGCSETLNLLDFENGTLERGKVHELSNHALLGKLGKELKQVGNTLASVSRSRHKRDVLGLVLVFGKENSVETLLGKGEDGLLETVAELVLGSLRLLGERVVEAVVVNLLPVVKTINLFDISNCFCTNFRF